MRHRSPGNNRLWLGVLCVWIAIHGSSYAQVEDEGGDAVEDESGEGFRLELGDRLHISGYGNAHYMNHDGVVDFVGERVLNSHCTHIARPHLSRVVRTSASVA